jgi:hypothetical protein
LRKLLSWNRFRCCTVKIRENSQNIFLTCDFLCICPRLYPNFHYFCTFLFEQQKVLEKIDLCQLFCFDRFLPLFVFAYRSLSFWVLLITEPFWEVDTVVYALYVVFLSWNLNQKGLIYYYVYANVANRVVWSFVWRKFSSVGIGEWWDELKNE